jgi:5-methylcytosine-specific restriction endonuclease McrA
MQDHPLYIKNRKEIINQMVEEYGYAFCQHCQRSDRGIECHHIIFRSECSIPEKVHDKKNLLILCPICHHQKFHGSKSIRNKYVDERGLNDHFGRNVKIEIYGS